MIAVVRIVERVAGSKSTTNAGLLEKNGLKALIVRLEYAFEYFFGFFLYVVRLDYFIACGVLLGSVFIH